MHININPHIFKCEVSLYRIECTVDSNILIIAKLRFYLHTADIKWIQPDRLNIKILIINGISVLNIVAL